MSDGSYHDITHHDMAWVTKSTVEVGLNPDADGFAEYVGRCSILHITKLEDLPESVAHRGRMLSYSSRLKWPKIANRKNSVTHLPIKLAKEKLQLR